MVRRGEGRPSPTPAPGGGDRRAAGWGYSACFGRARRQTVHPAGPWGARTGSEALNAGLDIGPRGRAIVHTASAAWLRHCRNHETVERDNREADMALRTAAKDQVHDKDTHRPSVVVWRLSSALPRRRGDV